jgi:ATPase subunit of ABC transporter with duplicated ATPase domains
MLSTNDITLQYGKRILFQDVSLKFTSGNCYGVIGANGAGKSTFLKILSGSIDANRGSVNLEPNNRMAVLSQDHFAFEEFQVLETVIMGHKEMYRIMKEKEAIYMDPEASEADGMRAADLENQFGEMGGWNAESDAAQLLSNLGIEESLHYLMMKDLTGPQKVKVLLAQALFGEPDILLLDEPTNDLDAQTVTWLSDFLADFKNTVIVVSHDRYFLDMVCTHIVDIDYSRIQIYTGNYTFWYESSQLASQQMANKNKKVEQKRKEMMEFIQRFSANASKSRQATSRKKALEKLNLEEIKPSSRKYPFIHFKPEREVGDQILHLEKFGAMKENGEPWFQDITMTMNPGDKIAVLSNDSAAITKFFEILSGADPDFEGTFEFGKTITVSYMPNDNHEYFSEADNLDLMNWLRQYSEDKDEQFIRGFLGRMLFSGEEVYKKSNVLSGGEKSRCILSKIMLEHPNFIIMDEPTNHLDLESITALNNGMTEFNGSLMFTTHDHKLIETVANRIIELTPNGIIDSLLAFDDYLVSDQIKEYRMALLP